MGPGFAVPYMIERHTRPQGETPCKRSVHQSSCHLNVLNPARWRVVLTGLDDLGRDALLLREADRLFDVSGRLARCFDDYRDPGRTEHGLAVMLAQRVMRLPLGYEDLNDHDRVRTDAALALALASGCANVVGAFRVRARDRGHALAGSSTLNRLELGPRKRRPPRHHSRAPTCRISRGWVC